MELEALQGINSEVRTLGAQIVVLTPELERYTRALHKKLNLTFDMLTTCAILQVVRQCPGQVSR
jgi:peroxiredoxin